MKKIVLISGSPRKGNTEFILSELTNRLKVKSELILLRKKKLGHCIGCMSCGDGKEKCVIKDDMAEILPMLKAADLIVLGAPNYYENVSGLMKDFIDRLHPYYPTEALKGKKTILINVGGGKKSDSEKNLNQAYYGMFKHMKMELAGSFSFQAYELKDAANSKIVAGEIEKIDKSIQKLIVNC